MRGILLVMLLAASAQAFFPVKMKDGVPIEVEKNFLGAEYYKQNGKSLRVGSMHEVMGRYPEARADVSASRNWMYASIVPSFAGGFMMGYAAFSPEFNSPLFFSGLGVAAIGILMNRVANNRLGDAVEKYNAALPASASLDWGWTPEQSRVALRLGF